MNYDDWKATNPADDALGTIHDDDDDEREPLAAALDRLLETGEVLRAEIERLTNSQWAWRFQWFWSQVATVFHNQHAMRPLRRLERNLERMQRGEFNNVWELQEDVNWAIEATLGVWVPL